MNLKGHIKHHKIPDLPVFYDKLTWIERREVKDRYATKQGGLCYYCECNLDGAPPEEVASKPINKKLFPASFNYEGVHLHHDHQTGLTIGAVHGYCNAVLWQYHGE